MSKIFLSCILLILICGNSYSQLYITRAGFVGFYSKTPLEDIRAENNQVYAVIDAGKKNLAFSLLMKGFIFQKELMQEHFNENYAETDKYPKANFNGIFECESALNKDGTYHIVVKGDLSIHNVTKHIEQPATLELSNGKLSGMAEFRVKPEDYNMKIPSIVRDKIANEMNVRIKVECKIAQ
jgi:YceI-like domain